MRRQKVVALGTRGARQRRQRAKVGPTPTTKATDWGALIAHLGTEVTLAMETSLSCVLGRETYLEYAREIHEKYGCPVDCPELRAAGRGKALRLAHLKALLRIAPDYAKLLERQGAERAKFRVRERYAELASAMFWWRGALQAGDVHDPFDLALDFDSDHDAWEREGECLANKLAMLGQQFRFQTGRADKALIETARLVADWTRARGGTGKRDWKDTAKICWCHGWRLDHFLGGVSSLERQAALLEDRVRKAAEKGNIPAP